MIVVFREQAYGSSEYEKDETSSDSSMMVSTESSIDTGKDAVVDETALIETSFGLSLDCVYKEALKYYRENETTLPYEKRLLFMAYAKQVRFGPFNDSADDSGWFDFVGNDRKNAWKALGDLSHQQAMSSFISLLDSMCPPFKNHLLDHNTLPPRKQIQEALNVQTYHQFRAYAQQQFVGDPSEQEALIKQLQEQHYQQYMAQVYAQQAKVVGACPESVLPPKEDSEVSDEEAGDDLPSNPAIAPASMWNRQDIVDFKSAIRKEGSEGVIKVGHGETVTVRVPTHEEGSCLFWEFATDLYDIGFGVLFEWTIAESNQVSVHVSESSDEELDEEQSELRATQGADIESGSRSQERQRDPNKPHIDEIVPIYRRDSHEEVYAGSHVYPGRGVYQLKFDNSYSLWRSKNLYYRVYYSQ